MTMFTIVLVNVTTIMFLMSGDLTGLCLYMLNWIIIMRLQWVLYYSDYMALARQIKVSHKYFLNSDHHLRYSLIFEVDVTLRFTI